MLASAAEFLEPGWKRTVYVESFVSFFRSKLYRMHIETLAVQES